MARMVAATVRSRRTPIVFFWDGKWIFGCKTTYYLAIFAFPSTGEPTGKKFPKTTYAWREGRLLEPTLVAIVVHHTAPQRFVVPTSHREGSRQGGSPPDLDSNKSVCQSEYRICTDFWMRSPASAKPS